VHTQVVNDHKDHEVVVDTHYEVSEIIGKGAYSIVFGGIDKRTGKQVAIKKIKASIFEDEVNTKRILREVMILRQTTHEAVTELLDLIPSRSRSEFNECCLVFGRMRTDLQRLIHSSTKLLPQHISYLGYQIFRALKYLHSIEVVHRDLTPSNILVSKGCDIKICDFGLSRKLEHVGPMTKHVVTRWYRAPEIMCRDEYDKPVDVWAAGCILVELYRRQALFPGDHFVHQLNLIFKVIGTPSVEDKADITADQIIFFLQQIPEQKPVDFNEFLKNTEASKEACDLISRILVFNPKKRIGVLDILDHEYFEQWHDADDEPSGEKPIEMTFENLQEIEDIKDLLWKQSEIMTKEKLMNTEG